MAYNQSKRDFLKDFSIKTGETAESVELVCISAEKQTLDALGLAMPHGKRELWGLIVFCTRGLYFYVSPHENYMAFLMRQMARTEAPAEQLVDMSGLEKLTFSTTRRAWYSFLFHDAKHTLEAAFEKNGHTHTFTFSTMRRAEEVMDKLLKKLPTIK